jgi:hypothetical protein
LPPNTFRTGFIATAEDGASVEFEKPSSNNWNLSYKPAPEAIRIAKQIDGSFSVPKEKPIILASGNISRKISW